MVLNSALNSTWETAWKKWALLSWIRVLLQQLMGNGLALVMLKLSQTERSLPILSLTITVFSPVKVSIWSFFAGLPNDFDDFAQLVKYWRET